MNTNFELFSIILKFVVVFPGFQKGKKIMSTFHIFICIHFGRFDWISSTALCLISIRLVFQFTETSKDKKPTTIPIKTKNKTITVHWLKISIEQGSLKSRSYAGKHHFVFFRYQFFFHLNWFEDFQCWIHFFFIFYKHNNLWVVLQTQPHLSVSFSFVFHFRFVEH